jgi:uncharacterized radical SAM superfamily Fe-S cluster-containing enzyme
MKLRDYSFLGTTQSLCPECLSLTPAKIISRGGRVYFRKRCPTHGEREDFVCGDVTFYDRMEYTVPAKLPASVGVEPDKGCPFDCGLCTEHEQHTCVGLVEITSSCNLTCPMCYASSAPGGKHLSLSECCQAIDRLVAVEGRPEILQLSGGEPTIHPQFSEILDYALAQPIDYVQINTNGLRLAHDPQLVETLARHRGRLEVFFQLDGLREEVTTTLRGEPLLKTKLNAIENLGRAGVHITLAVTLQGGVNNDQYGPLVRFGLERPWITGINFQPATYSGRHVLPEQLAARITFPDVIKGIARQTDGLFRESDFMPLPCAHPNCHSISYAYRRGDSVVPLTRFFDARANLDLLANGIAFTRPQAKDLLSKYLGRLGCCSGGCSTDTVESVNVVPLNGMVKPTVNGQGESEQLASQEFFSRVLAGELGARDVFRITITSFLDAYNFDVRRLMKCCTHHVLPSGHVIPFCAYNVLYRNGHVPLPKLTALARQLEPST